ncbi:uncharacterized protein PpBr36_09545 [Pyricularia pennisetigena]|uniref:uncharacterized protein n=1 Tax=Pyricularia pennisetigena TaxID=1578925 RepID=UPI00114E2565|nr:uncharacterized protein PpBr36_09545 [Pyricularia pennisetigena]TLS21861.1 hypothetical protein PpBr36_09545 [Pyricularia pennisetigena]
MFFFFRVLVTFLLQIATLVHAADTAAWKSRSIYFALTDRVARSSNDTGGVSCSNLSKYCGGTFKGLESKLDYIKGLGFDAIWINPVVSNKADGYHGYWAQDLYAINSNYGSAADLKSLVSAAHSKVRFPVAYELGIYVMVDVVANHMGPGNISDNRPVPLNQASSYHSNCTIDSSNQTIVENCRVANLPDINTQSSGIRTLLNTWVSWLVKEYSFDGVRIDTVKHVEKSFWPGFVSSIGAYAIGEVFSGDPSYLAGYADLMPGLLNYAVYYPMNRFYQQGNSPQELVDIMDNITLSFPDPAALGTFLDNHDNPRWLNQTNDQTLLQNALAFVFLSRGIPILYYGTEQGYVGGDDPANREDLWRSGFKTNTTLHRSIGKLNAARKAAGGLDGNDHKHLLVTDNAYAWSRAGGKLIVLTTNAGYCSSTQYCFNTTRANGHWEDVYGGGASVYSDGNGRACIDVVNGQPVVLLASTTPTTSAARPTNVTTPLTWTNTTTNAANNTANTACPTTVAVSFTERVVTVPGDTIKIVGSNAQLGNWNVSSAPALSASRYTSGNPIWNITLPMMPGRTVQYKFVKVSSSGAMTWESDPNRFYTPPISQTTATVSNIWR